MAAEVARSLPGLLPDCLPDHFSVAAEAGFAGARDESVESPAGLTICIIR